MYFDAVVVFVMKFFNCIQICPGHTVIRAKYISNGLTNRRITKNSLLNEPDFWNESWLFWLLCRQYFCAIHWFWEVIFGVAVIYNRGEDVYLDIFPAGLHSFCPLRQRETWHTDDFFSFLLMKKYNSFVYFLLRLLKCYA